MVHPGVHSHVELSKVHLPDQFLDSLFLLLESKQAIFPDQEGTLYFNFGIVLTEVEQVSDSNVLILVLSDPLMVSSPPNTEKSKFNIIVMDFVSKLLSL